MINNQENMIREWKVKTIDLLPHCVLLREEKLCILVTGKGAYPDRLCAYVYLLNKYLDILKI